MGKRPQGRTVTPVLVVNDCPQPVLVSGCGSGGIIPVATPNRATFAVDRTLVPTPGTAVRLAAQAIPDGFSVKLTALAGRCKKVYVGPSKAAAEAHLYAIMCGDDPLPLQVKNTNAIWIDADRVNDGVEWVVEV